MTSLKRKLVLALAFAAVSAPLPAAAGRDHDRDGWRHGRHHGHHARCEHAFHDRKPRGYRKIYVERHYVPVCAWPHRCYDYEDNYPRPNIRISLPDFVIFP